MIAVTTVTILFLEYQLNQYNYRQNCWQYLEEKQKVQQTHAVQTRGIEYDGFIRQCFRIFEIKFNCYIVAISDIVHTEGAK